MRAVYTNKTAYILTAVIILAVFSAALPADAQISCNVDWPTIPGAPNLNDICRGVGTISIGQLVLFLFTAALWIGGIIAFVALIYTGFTFVLSGQSPDMRERAKDRMQNVAWGIGILLLSVIALNLINPDITTLRDPTLGIDPAETPDSIGLGDPAISGPPTAGPGVPSPAPPATGISGTFSCGLSGGLCVVLIDNCNITAGYKPVYELCRHLNTTECQRPEVANIPCAREPVFADPGPITFLPPPVGGRGDTGCRTPYNPDCHTKYQIQETVRRQFATAIRDGRISFAAAHIFLTTVIFRESSWNPSAENPYAPNCVAVGLYQLEDNTRASQRTGRRQCAENHGNENYEIETDHAIDVYNRRGCGYWEVWPGGHRNCVNV
jgi:hypothetical protein